MILLVLLLFAKIFKSQLFTFGLFYFVSFKVGGTDSDEDVLTSLKDQDVLTSIEDKDVLASVKDKDVDNNEVKK